MRLVTIWIAALVGAGAVADDLLQSYDGDVDLADFAAFERVFAAP